MRHSGIVNLNRSRFFDAVIKNYALILLAIFFIVGIVIGVTSLGNNETVFNFAKTDFESYLKIRKNDSFGNVFFGSFFNILPSALLIFICGTSMVGVILTPIAVIYRGFCYGISAAYLYNSSSLQGIAFNSLILLPTTLIAVFGYLISGREAITFSINLAKISMPDGQTAGIFNDFRLYCRRSLLFLVFYAVSALIDAIMCVSFIKFFNF